MLAPSDHWDMKAVRKKKKNSKKSQVFHLLWVLESVNVYKLCERTYHSLSFFLFFYC